MSGSVHKLPIQVVATKVVALLPLSLSRLRTPSSSKPSLCLASLLSPCTTSMFQVSQSSRTRFAHFSKAALTRKWLTCLLAFSFNSGRAEPLRLALHIANTPFEDRRITKEEFRQLKQEGKLRYGTVPILEVRSNHACFVKSLRNLSLSACKLIRLKRRDTE